MASTLQNISETVIGFFNRKLIKGLHYKVKNFSTEEWHGMHNIYYLFTSEKINIL